MQSKKISSITNSTFINEKKFFTILRSYNASLTDSFKAEKKSIGFAFWAWKPIIILNLLENVPDSKVLLYADVGCSLVENTTNWRNLIHRIEDHDFITANSIGFGVKNYGDEEQVWTKPEIFTALDLGENHKTTPQIQATWILLKKNNTTVDFIKTWADYCVKDYFNLIRPASSFLGSNSKFVSNRADQSLFSCLLKINSLNVSKANKHDMEIIEASRNLSLFRFYGSNLPFTKKILKRIERFLIALYNKISHK